VLASRNSQPSPYALIPTLNAAQVAPAYPMPGAMLAQPTLGSVREPWTTTGKIALLGAFGVIAFGAFYMIYWVPRHGRGKFFGGDRA